MFFCVIPKGGLYPKGFGITIPLVVGFFEKNRILEQDNPGIQEKIQKVLIVLWQNELDPNPFQKLVTINLLVFRTNNKGSNLMNAKPCTNCINAINFTLKRKNYRLKKLSYTNEDGNICVLC